MKWALRLLALAAAASLLVSGGLLAWRKSCELDRITELPAAAK